MKRYLALLDYAHLDNGVFLSSFAQALAQHQEKEIHPVILHGDSEYTERVIQTGVMRDEAIIRSIKDLNHRLIALFADEGASTIGLNPYQRNFITFDGDKLILDHGFFRELSHQPALLLSTLVNHADKQKPVAIALPEMARFIYRELDVDEMIIFSKSDKAEVFVNESNTENMRWEDMDADFSKQQIPDDLIELNHPARLTTASDFHRVPNFDNAIKLE